MAKDMPSKARVGRDNQRYSASGERLVCGIVALSATRDQVLLVESTRRGGWVLPKGGWETDETTPEDAARREAWEEAGVVITITRDLGFIADGRAVTELSTHAPRARFNFFEATVDREESEWPEKDKRRRRWMRYSEARIALQSRPELAEALERSAITR